MVVSRGWERGNREVLAKGHKISVILQDRGRELQDDNVGKHGSPPCTTTSKLQLNYRTTIIQNH